MSLVYHQKLSGGVVTCYVVNMDTGRHSWLDLTIQDFISTWGQKP